MLRLRFRRHHKGQYYEEFNSEDDLGCESMKLKERRNFQVINSIRESLLDSEKDIEVLFSPMEFFSDIGKKFSEQELSYAVRYLTGKGYFDKKGAVVSLTSKAYDDWLFPNGSDDRKKIFISHASEDKNLAGKIKEELEKIGFNVFVAHDDIPATEMWRDKIISELKVSSIFVALRTKLYSQKQYTEQECGFALALNKRILSLCIDIKSSEMGFCSDFQGKQFETKGKDDVTKQIIDYLKAQLVVS